MNLFWVDNRFPTMSGGTVDFVDEKGNRVYPSIGDEVCSHPSVNAPLPKTAEHKGYKLAQKDNNYIILSIP